MPVRPPVVEVIPEFEGDDGEEISFDEYKEEKKRLRRRRIIGSTAASVGGFLAALIIFALLFDTGLIPIVDNFDPTALTSTDVGSPEVPTFDPGFGETPPDTSPGIRPTVSYTISWVISNVFEGRGGAMRVNLTNNAGTQIYVERVWMVPEWEPSRTYYTQAGWYVDPDEEVYIGLLGFSGPSGPGKYTYHFELDLLAQRPLLGTWADLGSENSRDAEMDVLPAESVSGYPIHTNNKDIYRKVNDLVQPENPRVASVADEVRQGLGDNYNIYWIASLFEWVLNELEYKSDPSENDVWSPAGETCTLLTGDCEDFSIVIASVVEHWGGNARFYIISKHAFAAVYLGPADMDTNAVASSLNTFYGTSARYSWFKDNLGYWIIADGTASQHLGGLPYNGIATDLQGGWDITDTEYLYVTDVYPNYPD
jgi:transglutaminase-like putative cysteine protease